VQHPQYVIPMPSRKLGFWSMRHSAIFAPGGQTNEPPPSEMIDRSIGSSRPIQTFLCLQNLEMSLGLRLSPLEKIHHVSVKGIFMRARTRDSLQSGTPIDELSISLGPRHRVLARTLIHLQLNGPNMSFPCHLGS